MSKKMFVLFIMWLAAVFWLVNSMVSSIEEAGGARAIIIETGKEIKEIAKEINED